MSQSLFRWAATVNAVFSASTGIAMAFTPVGVSQWLGHPYPLAIRLVGIGLLGFAVFLFALSMQHRRSLVLPLLVCIADLGWVVGTVVLALAWPDALSATGWVAAATVGLIVALFAVVQYAGLVMWFRSPGASAQGERHICLHIFVASETDALWVVVSDVANIHKYTTNLSDSRIVPGSCTGNTLVRECRAQNGQNWREILSIDHRQRRIDALFDTSRDGFPFPAREMTGGWELEESRSGTSVRIWWDLTPTRPRVFALALPVLSAMLAVQVNRLVYSMGKQTSPIGTNDFLGRIYRLMGNLC